MTEYTFKLLTECCCHGADCKGNAEMRVPSIRGQIRRWHEWLFGTDDMEACWGCCQGKTLASKVVLRVSPKSKEAKQETSILPHKSPKTTSSALQVGNTYTLQLSYRNFPTVEQKAHVEKAIKAWLLLGTLGLRANRAFGSVWDTANDNLPLEEFKKAVEALGLKDHAVSIAYTGSALMANCTDTVNGSPQIFGGINPRKPSPLKMKYIQLKEGCYLVLHAHKDGYLSGDDIIQGAIDRLLGHPIGNGKMKWDRIWPLKNN